MSLDTNHELLYWRRRVRAIEFTIDKMKGHIGVVAGHDKAEETAVMVASLAQARVVVERLMEHERKGTHPDLADERRYWLGELLRTPPTSFADFHVGAAEREKRGHDRGTALICREAEARYRNLMEQGIVLG